MQPENADNFETINESQNESKTLEVSSSSSSNSNFDSTDLQAPIYSLTKDPIYVDLARTICSEKKCMFCGKKRGKKNNKLHRISNKSITDAYIKTSILIPFNSRACGSHFDEYGCLLKSCLGNIKYYIKDLSIFILIFIFEDSLKPKHTNTKLTLNNISLLIKSLRDAAAHNNLAYKFSSIESLDDTLCLNITGKLSVIEKCFK